MEELSYIKYRFDKLFELDDLEKDPSFCKHFKNTYSKVDFKWESFFTREYLNKYNGLMIRGYNEINNIFGAVFPTEEVIDTFVKKSQKGDLLFLHHPVDIENGDPRGKLGRGFLPISKRNLKLIKKNELSVYACHAPLDYNTEIGTGVAIANSLNANIEEHFFPYGNGFGGLICSIKSVSTEKLNKIVKDIFKIPYIDFAGKEHDRIEKIAIVAGTGGIVSILSEVEEKGVQAFITGEVFSYIDNDYGKSLRKEIKEYIPKTNMSLIGVSHAASEYLVIKTLLRDWIIEKLKVEYKLIPQSKWWR